MASDRARSVLLWINEVEARPWLSEFYEDVLVDSRVPPQSVVIIYPPPLFDLDVITPGG